MPRYIDIEPIEKAAHDYGFFIVSIALINEQPTVDAVEVVRCKDCVHYWKNGNDEEAVCLASPKDDAFCSEGERRDDGENNS